MHQADPARHGPRAHWRDPRSPARRSIVGYVADGAIDAPLAALLWLLVEARVPVVVAAGPQGTGKSSFLHALLDLLPPTTDVRELAGYAEDFDWLPEAAALGWHPHGFQGVAPGVDPGMDPASRAGPAAPGGSPTSTVLLAHELSDHLPVYTWGEQARLAVRALSLGYGMAATIHADSLEEVFDMLGDRDVGLNGDELARLGVVVVLRALRDARTGSVVRRVMAVHYVRPVARDAAGHVQRLGPAVLATWDSAEDRFEDFSWGVTSELAERVGLTPRAFEPERDRRAAFLAGLARAGIIGPDEVVASIAHFRHAPPAPGA